MKAKINLNNVMLYCNSDKQNAIPKNIQDDLADLTAVGKSKPLGYIPLESLNNYYKVNVKKLKLLLEEQGIHTLIISSKHHNGNKLFFAYDSIELSNVLKENESKLIAFGWTAKLDDFLERLNKQWVEMEEDVYDVIAIAFGANYLLESKYIQQEK